MKKHTLLIGMILLSGVVCAKDSGPEFPSTEGWYFQYVTGMTLGEYMSDIIYNRPFLTPASKSITVEYFHSKEGRIARFSTRVGVVVMEILNPLPAENNANYWLKGVNRVGHIGQAHIVSFYLQPMLPGILFDQWRFAKSMEKAVTSETIRMKEDFSQSEYHYLKKAVEFQKVEFRSGRIQKYTARSYERGTTCGIEKKGVWPDDVLSEVEMNALALENPLQETVTFTYANDTSQWPNEWKYTALKYVETVGRLVSAKPVPPELTYAKVKEEWTRGLKPMLRGSADVKKPEKKPVVQYIGGGVLLFLFLLGGVWYYRRGREE